VHVSGKVIQLDLSDSVDLSSTAALKEEFEQAMSSDIASVRVNAQRLDYIDSSGVATLLFVRKLCTRYKASFLFESISAPVARVIKLANLDAVLGLPMVAQPITQPATSLSIFNNTIEPKFSDADAMAIFQNDLNSATSTSENSDTFQIKPGSFS